MTEVLHKTREKLQFVSVPFFNDIISAEAYGRLNYFSFSVESYAGRTKEGFICINTMKWGEKK